MLLSARIARAEWATREDHNSGWRAGVLRDQVVPALEQQRGFKGLTSSVDPQSGEIGVLTFWEDQSALEASADPTAQLRQDAITSMGARLGSVRNMEVMVEDMGATPPGPGSVVAITQTKMDPAKVDENVAFFRATVLPAMQAANGFQAVRNMVDRQAGQGTVGTIFADRAAAESWTAGWKERQKVAADQGIEISDPQMRQVIFTA